MLALTLATIALVQAPQAMKAWVDQEGDPSRPDSYVVSGFVELSPKAAWESANVRAQEERQERLAALGQGYLDRHVPAWLPSFISQRLLREWCADKSNRQGLEELDRDLIVRDHDFAKSYQGFLLLAEPDGMSAAPRSQGVRSLGQRLSRAKQEFIHRCGAIFALWGMLALGGFWLDRLTRGYMTVRLTLLALAVGAVGPPLIMLL